MAEPKPERFLVTGLELTMHSPTRTLAKFTLSSVHGHAGSGHFPPKRVYMPPISTSLNETEVREAKEMVYGEPHEGLFLELKEGGPTGWMLVSTDPKRELRLLVPPGHANGR